MTARIFQPIVALFILAWALGCSSGSGRPVQEVSASLDEDGVQRIDVVAHSYWFEPNRIVVKVNVPVELRVRNGSLIVPHNLTCHAPESGIQIDEGLGMFKDTEVAVFTPTQTGEFRFFCDKGSHAKKGMVGTLVVVP